MAISRDAYDQYVRVFTAPDGSVVVSEEDVLLSLVNQVIVRREADRRGIIVADQDVTAAITDMEHLEHSEALSLPGANDDAGFRERVRNFLLFKLVKAEVVGHIEIADAMLEEEYQSNPNLQVIGRDEALSVLQERLIRQESDRRWTTWLDAQRSCAPIDVLDPSFDVPSSTPGPECRAPTNG